MPYFVHPQIKFNIKNIAKLKLCFLGNAEKEVERKIKEMFPQREVYFTDMGRNAFRLIVERFALQNSEMLFPAYICDVFYPILKHYNIKPVFLDANIENFNINTAELEKKITKNTKSILISHTYGKAVEIDKVLSIAKKHGILVVEDCAHSLGGKYQGKYLGSFGDASFFSLYKLFPTLRGGMAIFKTENLKPEIQESLPKTRFSLRDYISLLNTFPFFSFLFKKYANRVAPKYIKKEKLPLPAKLNRISLNIFSWHLKDLEKVLEKRKELALYYKKELEKLGFKTQPSQDNCFTFLSALSPKNIDRDDFILELRKRGVFALRIWREPIVLNKEVQQYYNINSDDFPSTREIAKRIINFPLQNFYTKKDIEKIISAVKEELKDKL
jgi:dTDP-4-amino-4,6-dideoxygalactose transaminase